jgi:quercetin dioxygenase-like cupin family protein
MSASLPPIRRVVAGHDKTGKAIIVSDGPAANSRPGAAPGNVSTLIWATDQMPAEVWTGEDFGAGTPQRQPPARACRFSVLDIPPGNPGAMHGTVTCDYIVVLEGEIDMDMPDTPPVTLKKGDVMVQQGTVHRWVNRSKDTCRLAIALFDALPAPDASRPKGWEKHPKPGTTGAPPNPPIRRLVTAHDAAGKPVITQDGPASNHKWSGRGTVATLIWATEGCPLDNWTGLDQGERVLGHQPPFEGTRFSVNDYPPGTPGQMHVTDTLDFAIILKGSIRMDLDDSTVRLNAGDILIQQANNHSWIADGTEPCRIAFVLMEAKKPQPDLRRPIPHK